MVVPTYVRTFETHFYRSTPKSQLKNLPRWRAMYNLVRWPDYLNGFQFYDISLLITDVNILKVFATIRMCNSKL